MVNNLESELESINKVIHNLTNVLEEKSKRAKLDWARNQMRAIVMDLQELTKIRTRIMDNIKNQKN